MPAIRPSGRGGPAPDPKALRRSNPADSTSWTRLPARGLTQAPAWPAVAIDDDAPPSERHFVLWDELWTTYPQAHVWKRQRMHLQVATYVFLALQAAAGIASAAYLAQMNRLADTLLINPHAMRAARCIIDEAIDDVIEERTNLLGVAPVIQMPTGPTGGAQSTGPSARDRLIAKPQPQPEQSGEPDDGVDDAEGYLS
jgi:hypothetical protein